MWAHDPRSAQDMSTSRNLCSPVKSCGQTSLPWQQNHQFLYFHLFLFCLCLCFYHLLAFFFVWLHLLSFLPLSLFSSLSIPPFLFCRDMHKPIKNWKKYNFQRPFLWGRGGEGCLQGIRMSCRAFLNNWWLSQKGCFAQNTQSLHLKTAKYYSPNIRILDKEVFKNPCLTLSGFFVPCFFLLVFFSFYFVISAPHRGVGLA